MTDVNHATDEQYDCAACLRFWDKTRMDLVRDYERQLAEARYAQERAEVRASTAERTLRDFITPERALEALNIYGYPAKDIVSVHKLMSEWRRAGGSESMLEWYRKERGWPTLQHPITEEQA